MSESEPAADLVQFDVEATGESHTRTLVETRGFDVIVDEPPALGGTDEGPNPVEYLLGSLAGCLNVVGHLVADEMDIDLNGIRFRAEGDLDPAKLQGTSDEPRPGFQEVRVAVDVDADADPEELEDWLETVEERCPVTDNLRNPTPVEIEIAGG